MWKGRSEAKPRLRTCGLHQQEGRKRFQEIRSEAAKKIKKLGMATGNLETDRATYCDPPRAPEGSDCGIHLLVVSFPLFDYALAGNWFALGEVY